jgi:Tol biopolymer transport system component
MAFDARRRSVRLALGLLVASATFAARTPAIAGAEFTQASLLSGTARQQFDGANAPALSTDGRYAAFQGQLEGVPGIYRRDLQTGAIEMVAGGDAGDFEHACDGVLHPLVACDATAPSVSADGRYVAFTSTADLDPSEEPPVDAGCPEVYVRDMTLQPSTSGAYELASALANPAAGIEYEGGCEAPSSMGFHLAGAQAAPGVALSADGRHVVFTVLSGSNLAGPGTPPGQVAVRDLDTNTTTLVTTTPNGQATPGGGAFPSTESLANIAGDPTVGLARFQERDGDQAAGSTAAISADASTVAWLGTNVSAQVSAAEAERAPSLIGRPAPGREAEPLWRRVADGSNAVTRRLLVGAGLDFFYERVDEPTNPVRSGAFAGQQNLVFIPPALSADGRTVGVIASAPSLAGESSLAERANTGLSNLDTDAYVVRMGAGSTSPPTTTTITEIASYMLPISATEDVKDVAISPDGTRVAFDTQRTQLHLPALALTSPPVAFTATAETYEANLELGTLQRVTTTYDGAEPNGEAGLLSFGGDGRTLAFASSATNLFYGDGVGAWEVYQARELPSETASAVEEVGAPPPAPGPSQSWTLSATATAERDGSVLVTVETPGAGRLAVKAGAQLPSLHAKAIRKGAHVRRGAHVPVKRARKAAIVRAARAAPAGRAVRGSKRRRVEERSAGATIPARTVAQVSATALGSAEMRLRLRVSAAYKQLVAGGNGLYAVLSVTFAAPDHRTLLREVPVTFHLIKRKPAPHRRIKR